ncbi:hypothetical protein [Izhakiella capsodis]|nr:hypothetical protein [Izhakiella capsodis]
MEATAVDFGVAEDAIWLRIMCYGILGFIMTVKRFIEALWQQ